MSVERTDMRQLRDGNVTKNKTVLLECRAVVEQIRRSYPVDDRMMLLAPLAGRNSFD